MATREQALGWLKRAGYRPGMARWLPSLGLGAIVTGLLWGFAHAEGEVQGVLYLFGSALLLALIALMWTRQATLGRAVRALDVGQRHTLRIQVQEVDNDGPCLYLHYRAPGGNALQCQVLAYGDTPGAWVGMAELLTLPGQEVPVLWLGEGALWLPLAAPTPWQG